MLRPTLLSSAALLVFSIAPVVSAQPAPPAPATPAPATTPATTAPVAADQTTPRGAIRVLTEAIQAGDQDGILGVLHAANPTEQEMAVAMADIANAMSVMRENARAAFGEEGAQMLGGNTQLVAQGLERLGQARETVDGDTAVVVMPDQPTEAITLTRVDGQWKLAVAELARDTDPAMLAQSVEVAQVSAEIIREAAAEVQQGKFQTPEEANQALQTRTFQAVMQKQLEPTPPQPPQEPAEPMEP